MRKVKEVKEDDFPIEPYFILTNHTLREVIVSCQYTGVKKWKETINEYKNYVQRSVCTYTNKIHLCTYCPAVIRKSNKPKYTI